MNRPARPGELRSRNTIRRGAEEGVTQVLAPAEILRLLDRVDELERIERAVMEFTDAAGDRTDPSTYPRHVIDGLYEALAHRRTRADDARG